VRADHRRGGVPLEATRGGTGGVASAAPGGEDARRKAPESRSLDKLPASGFAALEGNLTLDVCASFLPSGHHGPPRAR